MKYWPIILAILVFPIPVAGHGMEAMLQDKVEVWVELNIHHQTEHTFQAGDPTQTVRSRSETGFRRAGVWTFARLKGEYGGGYRAFPGRLPDTAFPAVTHVGVTHTHPCQDGQGLLIGRQTVHPEAIVHPALGGIELGSTPARRVRVFVTPSQVEYRPVACPNPDCNAGFPSGSVSVGENPEATEEDEHGFEMTAGYEVAVFDWASLVAVAQGGEVPLTLPLAAEGVRREEHEDPPGYPAGTVEIYRVTGWVGPIPD